MNALRQSESDQRIAPVRIEQLASPRGRDYDVLFAVLALIRDRRGVRSGFDLLRPDFFAGLRIEGAEAVVVGRSDEHQSAGGRDRASQIGSAGIALALRQVVAYAQGGLP